MGTTKSQSFWDTILARVASVGPGTAAAALIGIAALATLSSMLDDPEPNVDSAPLLAEELVDTDAPSLPPLRQYSPPGTQDIYTIHDSPLGLDKDGWPRAPSLTAPSGVITVDSPTGVVLPAYYVPAGGEAPGESLGEALQRWFEAIVAGDPGEAPYQGLFDGDPQSLLAPSLLPVPTSRPAISKDEARARRLRGTFQGWEERVRAIDARKRAFELEAEGLVPPLVPDSPHGRALRL